MSFTDTEAALRKIAADNGLTYVSFGLHIMPHRTFFSVKGHADKLAKSGIGPTLEAAIKEMLAGDFLDTAPLSAERERIETAGRLALAGSLAA